MLGNDVVDLGDPETQPGASHPRFDARVFTQDERASLAAAPDRARLRWRLWAAKEAAYKCSKKLEPRTVFAPARISVQLDDADSGSVCLDGRRLRVAFFEVGDALHAVASDGAHPERTLLRAVGSLPHAADSAHASAAVRALACELAAAHLGCAPEEIEVDRDGRAPRLRRRGAPVGLDLSLAHHGRFLAAALEARPRERAR